MKRVHAVVRWLRKVPVVAWLVFAVVVLALAARKFATLAALRAQKADALQDALQSRREYVAESGRITAQGRAARAQAIEEHAKAVDRLEAIEKRIATESQRALADDLNAYFAGPAGGAQ